MGKRSENRLNECRSQNFAGENFNNVGAFFKATFDAWKNASRSGRERIYVGYSPAIVIDAALVLSQMPNAQLLQPARK